MTDLEDHTTPEKSATTGGRAELAVLAGWQPMDTAPRDGTPIQADIPGNGKDDVIAWLDGFLDAAEQDCCGWVFVEDQEPPACWTDGACWASNDEGVPSVQPVAWKSLYS